MDTVFQRDADDRANFLRNLAQTTGCSYVCLWSYVPLSSYLCSLDGLYQETGSSVQPSSSSESLARRLFNDYRACLFIIDDNHRTVPGTAFRNNLCFFEVREEDFPRMATNRAQQEFYREAWIKKAVFMGCRTGEIELGFSDMSPVDAETLLRNIFPEDFSRQVAVQELPRLIEQQLNPPSSSSSSWRSLSIDSPEYSSILFNLPGNSFMPDSLKEVAPTINPQTASPQTLATAAPAIIIPQQLQAIQALARISNFPTPGSEHEAIRRAFLAVITSPSSSTSSSQQQQQQQNLPGINQQANLGDSAFRRYSSALIPTAAQMKRSPHRRDNMTKRAIAYFRNLNLMRFNRQRAQASAGSRPTPTSTQLHHMMSERKRREKLNESLQALKALLPPGTKRDKASVLATTREYLTSLQAQIEELRQRNAALEAQLSPAKEAGNEEPGTPMNGNPIDVRVRQTSESTSQDRTADLQVVVRRECSSTQLVIHILEFLRRLNNVHLMSMEADTCVAEAGVVTRVNLRLRIEGNEWDESAFQEAVRRVVADVAQRQF
ncbi:hypothetical protein CRG98_030524 [Punica granatum]|uniref:BHLH domain-containing protein n=1 Tax=Punica granatum TaxID=22663 RepID=A0A2I0IYI2_PUNGR|nr:hypothetical protein CRG98_030524 [Punica granatum]